QLPVVASPLGSAIFRHRQFSSAQPTARNHTRRRRPNPSPPPKHHISVARFARPPLRRVPCRRRWGETRRFNAEPPPVPSGKSPVLTNVSCSQRLRRRRHRSLRRRDSDSPVRNRQDSVIAPLMRCHALLSFAASDDSDPCDPSCAACNCKASFSPRATNHITTAARYTASASSSSMRACGAYTEAWDAPTSTRCSSTAAGWDSTTPAQGHLFRLPQERERAEPRRQHVLRCLLRHHRRRRRKPFFLVKTRLQSYSPFRPVGTQHQYRNAIDGLSQIYRAEGIRGLYRGVGAAMIRTGFGSSVQLPTYFFAKRRLVRHAGMEEGPALHLASSTVSGFVVCCFMHPPDTIMSRLYNQNGNLYKGVFDCLGKTIRTEGFFAIYKGFLPHLARILPHTILTLSLAEQTNKLMRKFEGRVLPMFDKA
ncbi:hypothetical protein ACCO45_002342, partial [Purpureocillium lilacinum]